MNKKKTKTSDVLDTGGIATKILHILSIYPIISPTMLQGGLGPYMKPAQWRPVLADLITKGKVVETQESMMTPNERYNTYNKLSLPGTKVSTRDG